MASVDAKPPLTRIVPVLHGTVHRVDLPDCGTVELAPARNYSGVVFTGVDLSRLTLTDCIFDGAVFDNCIFGATDLSRSSFNGAVFTACELEDPSFFWCRLEDTRFERCTATAVRFTHCRFMGATISGNIDGVRMRNCTLVGTRISDAVMNGFTVYFSSFNNCVIERTSMPEGTFGKVQMSTCVLDRVVLWKTLVMKLTLQDCKFVAVGLNEGSVLGCAWHDTFFHGCRFRLLRKLMGSITRCTFERCSFEETDLTVATYEDCRFLIPSHSEGTTWPEGMEPGTEPLPV